LDRTTARKLADAASAEIERALSAMPKRVVRPKGKKSTKTTRRSGDPRLFHLSHLIRDEERVKLEAQFGSLSRERVFHRRSCYTDARVGSSKRDQVSEGGLQDNSNEEESYRYVEIPIGNDLDGFRHALWQLTDARVREAEDAWLRKRATEITYIDPNRHLDAFLPLSPVDDLRFSKLPEIDLDRWRKYVVRASAVPKKHPMIKTSHVELRIQHQTRIYVSSEGVRRIDRHSYWSLECYLWHLSAKGDGLPWSVQHTVCDPEELPSPREFHREIRDAIALLERIAAAPVVRSYSGPVLLEPTPAGLLIHEALGHRLEGSRLLSPGEGQTFRDSVGKTVLPEFLSLSDNPQLAEYDGESLIGHYRFDDEGVEAQEARLIVDGRLKGFLTSRTPIGKKHQSNGHGRAHYHERPISRMGVTILESSEGLPENELRERLLEEIRRQKVPFGIRVLHATGGETTTEAYDFQAFLGEINLASRVYPDGREELIRGVNFVGTPLNAIRGIMASGDRSEVDNAWCGAESGYVPVSTISPALLVRHLELQSKSETPYTQYAYPIPWGG
jgi:TldD protein